MTEMTLHLDSTDKTITIRKPSEEEVLRYLDKRSKFEAGVRASADAYDDGDYELMACVVTPTRAELEELLEDMPLLNRQLRSAFLQLSGGTKGYKRDDSVIPADLKKSQKRLIGIMFDETPIILSKIGRFEMKTIEAEVRDAELKGPLPSSIAKVARQHVVTTPDEKEKIKGLLDEIPLLAVNLGWELMHAAVAKITEDEKKS